MPVLFRTAVLAAACALAGCAAPQGRTVRFVAEPEGPIAALKIPSEQFPPPGQCRLWLPEQPAEEQPDAEACYSLHGHVPPGAWVLYRPPREERLIEVTAYDARAPKRVVWVRYFEMDSGRFVQEVAAN